MIELSTIINRAAYNQPLELWTVSLIFSEDLRLSSVKLFSSYTAAKHYFSKVVPEESAVEASEDCRIQAEEMAGVSNIRRFNRQQYVNNDYYESWCTEEWSGDNVMSWCCWIQKIKVDET